MDNSSEKRTQIKVGILGDKKVGKTYLTHKIVNKVYEEYIETTEISNLSPDQANQVTFSYIDNPALDNQSIIQIGSIHHYDILVFIFKDCDSFTKLYEFLAQIKEVIDNCSNHHVKQYWENLKKVIIVYTDFQSELPVQLDQLFTILKEEIQSFSRQTKIVEFSHKNQNNSFEELKKTIEVEHIFMEEKKLSSMKQDQTSPKLEKEDSFKENTSQELKEQKKQAEDGKEQIKKQQEVTNQIQVNVILAAEQNKEKEQAELTNARQSYQSQMFDRKSKIYKKIQDSFFGSSMVEEESKVDHIAGAPNQYVDIKENQNILEEFRQPSHEDQVKVKEIEQKLDEYNEHKIEELKKENQISQTQDKKEVEHEKKDEEKEKIKNKEEERQINKVEQEQNKEVKEQKKQEKVYKQEEKDQIQIQKKESKDENKNEKIIEKSVQNLNASEQSRQQLQIKSKSISEGPKKQAVPKPLSSMPNNKRTQAEKPSQNPSGCNCLIM